MEQIVCSQCKEEKPCSEFRKRADRVGARRSYRTSCKACEKAYFGKRYHVGGVKEKHAAYNRTAAYREKEKARRKGYPPETLKARYAVNNAVKAGRLPHVRSLQCKLCGSKADHYHHHLGYDEENRLNVIPVCRVCHDVLHGKEISIFRIANTG